MTEEKPLSAVEDVPSKTAATEANKAPERWISIFGFVIVTKADLLAAAAFLLSLTTVVYQFSSWLKGPSPSVYPPDLVYIFFDQYANNKTVVRFAAQLSFVNTAEPGHDAIVREITLEVNDKKIDNKNNLAIREQWLSFVTIWRDKIELRVVPKEAAHPFPVVAGGAASNTVSFAPVEQVCGPSMKTTPPTSPPCEPDQSFVTDTDFLNAIHGIDSITLNFTTRIVGTTNPLLASCTVPVGIALRQYLAENDWFAAKCNS